MTQFYLNLLCSRFPEVTVCLLPNVILSGVQRKLYGFCPQPTSLVYDP